MKDYSKYSFTYYDMSWYRDIKLLMYHDTEIEISSRSSYMHYWQWIVKNNIVSMIPNDKKKWNAYRRQRPFTNNTIKVLFYYVIFNRCKWYKEYSVTVIILQEGQKALSKILHDCFKSNISFVSSMGVFLCPMQLRK